MKIKPLLTVILAILTLSLTACGSPSRDNSSPKGTPSDSSFAENSNVQPAENVEAFEALTPTATGFKNLSKNMVAVLGSGTEGGCYETYVAADGASNIVYIDYASAKEIYLCAAPNCNHSTDACNSYIPAEESGMFPLVAGEHLLLVNITYGDEEGYKGVPRIERLNLDGSDRQVLIEFERSEYLGDVFASNGESVICSIKTIDPNDSNLSYLTLTSIDLNTGARNDFYSAKMTDSGITRLLGVTSDGYCILMGQAQTKTVADFPELSEEDATIKALESVKDGIVSVPVGINREKYIAKLDSTDVRNSVIGEGLLIYSSTREVSLISAQDASSKLIATLPEHEKLYSGTVAGQIDNWALIDTRTENDGYSTVKRYAINIETGEIQSILFEEKVEQNTMAPFVIDYDSQNVLLAKVYASKQNVHFGYQFYLMNKDDYLSGGTNSKVISFIEDR